MDCPKCQNQILSENINVQKDFCLCIKCSSEFKLTDLINGSSDNKFNIQNTPKGTWYSRKGNSITISASTRSWMAIFLIPFIIIWSGGSLGGIYGTQIFKGEFNPLLSLFGIPFLIGPIAFWSLAIMTVAGRTKVTLDNNGGTIFTGFRKIGFSKTFK